MLNTIIIANFIGLRNVITSKIRVKTNFLNACVANNRFIGCLVGSLFRKYQLFVTRRLPTRSNPLNRQK